MHACARTHTHTSIYQYNTTCVFYSQGPTEVIVYLPCQTINRGLPATMNCTRSGLPWDKGWNNARGKKGRAIQGWGRRVVTSSINLLPYERLWGHITCSFEIAMSLCSYNTLPHFFPSSNWASSSSIVSLAHSSNHAKSFKHTCTYTHPMSCCLCIECMYVCMCNGQAAFYYISSYMHVCFNIPNIQVTSI